MMKNPSNEMLAEEFAKDTQASVPDIIKNLNPVVEQFDSVSQKPTLTQIPNTANISSPKEVNVSDDLGNAALIGGNAMASSEPFGPVIGAATGMVEEAIAILEKKQPIVKNTYKAKTASNP